MDFCISLQVYIHDDRSFNLPTLAEAGGHPQDQPSVCSELKIRFMSLFSSLDSEASEDCDEDISDYINSRLVSSPRICDNIRGRDTSDPAAKPGGGLLGSLHGHLVRKAGGCFLYVEGEGGVAARDLPALLLALASEDVTAALAGADPSCRTQPGSTPGTSLLGAHCRLSNTEMVALLLEWGASVDTGTPGTGGATDH